MLKKTFLFVSAVLAIGVSTSAQGPRRVAAGDWPEQRGPSRDGVSRETGLIDQWAVNGQNFLWRVPGGGRSAPIVMGNRVYVQRPIGQGTTLQEQIVAIDADEARICAASVPTATAAGMPATISSGVIRKPPPTPNIPDRKPTAPPMARKTRTFANISATGR
jgi:hypothetical protein